MNAGFGSWLFGIALGASALGGMLGMASGIFIVPILTLFGGVDLHTAIGASIVSVIACSCSSAALSLEGGLTNVRLAIVLETATTLGALTGLFFVGNQNCSNTRVALGTDGGKCGGKWRGKPRSSGSRSCHGAHRAVRSPPQFRHVSALLFVLAGVLITANR